MAANIPGVPFKLDAESMGVPSYTDALMKGFKMFKEQQESYNTPQKLAADLLKSKLENMIKGAEAQYAPRRYAADAAYKEGQVGLQPYEKQFKQAQINKLLNPEPKYNNLEKAMHGLARIKQQYGEGSNEAKQAEAYAQRIAQGSQGTSLTVDPQTGAVSFSQGGSSRGGPQQAITTDENGNQVIVQKPTTPVSTAQQNAGVANAGREFIGKNFHMPYSGALADASLYSDLAAYNSPFTSPEQKEKIGNDLVDAAVMNKLENEITGFVLNANRQRDTVSNREHQRKATRQGWAAYLDFAVNNLPKELQDRVDEKAFEANTRIKEEEEKYQAKGFPVKTGNNKTTDNQKTTFTKPKVKTKEEFRKWYESLPPKQREEAKKLYGAK